MIEKKSVKGNLERRRKTFFLIGFIVALGLIYAGFELYATANEPKDSGILPPLDVPDIFNVIPTDPPPPENPPPPQLVPILKIINTDPTKFIDISNFWIHDNLENIEIGDFHPIPLPIEINDLPPPVPHPEVNPEPIGGLETMYAFLRTNLVYPEFAIKNNIQGQVYVRFVVERDGSISDVNVIAGVYPDLDKEAVRVVKIMPKWKPGTVGGKAVRCNYNIPIRFILN
jgi:protein TonB